jgi:hypothetical protein
MSDQPVARPLPNINRKNTDIHASSWTQTHDPSVQASEGSSCLRPRGHCDHQLFNGTLYFIATKSLDQLFNGTIYFVSYQLTNQPAKQLSHIREDRSHLNSIITCMSDQKGTRGSVVG